MSSSSSSLFLFSKYYLISSDAIDYYFLYGMLSCFCSGLTPLRARPRDECFVSAGTEVVFLRDWLRFLGFDFDGLRSVELNAVFTAFASSFSRIGSNSG